MRLSVLLNSNLIPSNVDRDITRLILDSREIQKNDLFLAMKGTQTDGRQYIADAIAKGASAVFVESSPTDTITWQENVPLIPLPHLSDKIAQFAACFYGFPAKKLRMIGVTGTNGKTSCTHFIAQILQSLQIPCGILGTLGYGFYGHLSEPGLTTPDAITLQKTLQLFLQQGAKATAMEVSSHGIQQGRANDIPFETGIFTNLSQDHLDYHSDMQSYASVKRRFLAEFPIKNLIINADDPYGKKWMVELASEKSLFAYSLNKPVSIANIPTIYADHIQLALQGIRATVHTPWGESALSLPLVGQFNLSNVLAVLTALCIYGIPFETVCTHLNSLKSVPGRMQMLGGSGKALIVVDYAHTPDALEKVLQTLRAHTQGKLICVFGCGGDRDHGKRPLMAAIAERLADKVIVTNDNPRHENPEDIAQQISQGFLHPERVFVELDRSKAIAMSIQLASQNDCILIAGKGAERYQQIGDEKYLFDDAEEMRRYS